MRRHPLREPEDGGKLLTEPTAESLKFITSQRISKKTCMFSKNTGYLFRKKLKHDNNYYKQALVVAQYQILIRCYSAMFRNEI